MNFRNILAHETINTVIALIAIAIASATAWNQFRLPSDRLIIASEGRANFKNLVQVSATPLPLLPGGRPNPIVGPVFWKVLIYNERDRPVSLVKFETFLLPEVGKLVQYSGLRHSIVHADKPQTDLNTPINLGPREARAIYVGLKIPVENDPSDKDKCIRSGVRIKHIERCFFKRGRDLFGNKVEAKFFTPALANSDNDIETEEFMVTWDGPRFSPTFLFNVWTADGSVFPVTITYYPNFS